MAFPTSPVDGDQATVNGINYTYSAATSSWKRSSGTLASNLSITGNVTLNSRSTFFWYDSTNSGYVGFRAPSTVSANIVYSLPANDGTSLQVLTTDGAQNLSWATVSGGGGSSGFINSTVTTAPGAAGNYDLAKPTDQTQPVETPFEPGGQDAFGVSLGIIYDDMEPIGRIVTIDYGDGEPYVGG